MTHLADKQAAEALLRLLEKMRDRGMKFGRIEVLVENGLPTSERIVKSCESEVLAIKS